MSVWQVKVFPHTCQSKCMWLKTRSILLRLTNNNYTNVTQLITLMGRWYPTWYQIIWVKRNNVKQSPFSKETTTHMILGSDLQCCISFRLRVSNQLVHTIYFVVNPQMFENRIDNYKLLYNPKEKVKMNHCNNYLITEGDNETVCIHVYCI